MNSAFENSVIHEILVFVFVVFFNTTQKRFTHGATANLHGAKFQNPINCIIRLKLTMYKDLTKK